MADLAPPVSVLIVVPIGLYVLGDDFTDLRRTGEVLILVRGQHFPLNIGKVKIVERTAIEYGNDESAGAAIGELAFQDEIRRELVDSAAGRLHCDQQRPLEGRWRRGIDHGAVATVIEAVMTVRAVSAHI